MYSDYDKLLKLKEGMNMSQHARFKFKDKDALLNKAEELGIDLPFSDDIKILFEKVSFNSKQTQNRFAVHPMEGFDSEPDGSPGDQR